MVRRLHHDPDDPDEVIARSVLDQITRQVAYDKEQNAGYRHMISSPSLRKRTLLVIFLGYAPPSVRYLSTANGYALALQVNQQG